MDFKKMAKVVYKYRSADKKELAYCFKENKKLICQMKSTERIFEKNSQWLKENLEKYIFENEVIPLMLGKSKDKV